MFSSALPREEHGEGSLHGVWVLVLAAVFAASLLVAASFAPGAEAQTTTPGVLTGKKVVLDAGHGGSDDVAPNAVYNLKEKDQNLNVANRLKTYWKLRAPRLT